MNEQPPAPDNNDHGRALPASKDVRPLSVPSSVWTPPTTDDLQYELPHYHITKMLGRGGMGAVYMGRQTSLDRPVAIKILSGALEEKNAGFTERFKNEARAMAKLNHPGIISVYDFGQTASGLLYIVMEYVDGTDVAKMIVASGRLHTEHAMAITAHVCDALAYAHERGIIHRDIKPANIMVGYDGVVKVADFGLAKVSASGATSGLTQSNVVMGTLHYMAPEAHIEGINLDQRADIYAVGVMLYQMLTGKLPQGMFELPSLRVSGLDPRYDKIVATALRDDRELRYPSAEAMRRDLDAVVTQPVLKLDPARQEAPAALPTRARPKRPGMQQNTHPATQPSPQTKPQRGTLLWAAAVAVCVLPVWFFLSRKGDAQTSNLPHFESMVPSNAIEGRREAVASLLALGAKIRVTGHPSKPSWVIEDASLLPVPFYINEVDVRATRTKRMLSDADIALITALHELPVLLLTGQKKLTQKGIEQLRLLKTIRTIDFTDTSLNDAGAEWIATLPTLTVLHFDSTLVTDKTLVALASRTNYAVLRLSHCSVTDVSAKTLGTFEQLKRLEVVDTKLSPQAIDSLRQRLPYCKIID